MSTKICKICKIEKPYSDFHKIKGCIGGVRTVCKICRYAEKTEYHSRPEVKKRQHELYILNKVSIRARTKAHYHSLNGQFHQYKKGAKKRGIIFDLKEEDCVPFYNTTCSYCGDPIKGLGIDRVDSSQGYTLNNTAPCCSTCNFMKHVLSRTEFYSHINKIVHYKPEENGTDTGTTDVQEADNGNTGQ